MAKATDISAPILTGTAGTESPLSGIDLQSKAAFENALRAAGMDNAVEKFVQENPQSFLTPSQSYQLEQLGPEEFWPKYYGTTPTAASKSATGANFDLLIPQTNNGSPFVSQEYNSDGWLIAHYADGSTKYILQDPSRKTTTTTTTKTSTVDQAQLNRKSAYDLLYQEFSQYGLGSLAEAVKGLITDPTVSSSEFYIRLQQTPEYQQRFSANKDRIAKGLRPLDPATYLRMEDQYQQVMRNYGLPESYWKTGPMGVQEGFTKLLANDVDPTELEDRILNAQNRVLNANPEVINALKNFYPDIKNGDILAYVLDPQNALSNIKKKITASEIGGAAMAAGLQTSVGRAEQLGSYGVTGQQYQQASPFLASAAERGSQLASIYNQGSYGLTQAEQEAFSLGGSTEAIAQRKKLKALEEASFTGSSGTSGGALSRDRAITPYMMGMPGAGAF